MRSIGRLASIVIERGDRDPIAIAAAIELCGRRAGKIGEAVRDVIDKENASWDELKKVAEVVRECLAEMSPCLLETLELQVQIAGMRKETMKGIDAGNRKCLDKRGALVDEILQCDSLADETFSMLKLKIVDLMCVMLPDDRQNYACILDEIYTQSSLTAFILLDREKKQQRLQAMIHIVFGIDQYRQSDCSIASDEDAKAALKHAQDLLKKLEGIGMQCSRAFAHGSDESEMQKARMISTWSLFVQCRLLVQKLQTITMTHKQLKSAWQRVVEKLDLLMDNEDCGAKSDAGYYFEALGKLKIQNTELTTELDRFTSLMDQLTDTVKDQPWVESDISYAQDHLGDDCCRDQVGEECEQQDVAWNGFCPVTFVNENGRLTLASRDIENHLVCFCSKDCRAQFENGQERIEQGVERLLHKEPLFQCVLGLAQQSENRFDIAKLLTQTSTEPLMCHRGTETPLHFIDKRIDQGYESNLWTMRKRALSAANLKHKKPIAIQTEIRHFRRDSSTQHWPPKTSTTQTKTSTDQSMPKHLTHISSINFNKTAYQINTSHN